MLYSRIGTLYTIIICVNYFTFIFMTNALVILIINTNKTVRFLGCFLKYKYVHLKINCDFISQLIDLRMILYCYTYITSIK